MQLLVSSNIGECPWPVLAVGNAVEVCLNAASNLDEWWSRQERSSGRGTDGVVTVQPRLAVLNAGNKAVERIGIGGITKFKVTDLVGKRCVVSSARPRRPGMFVGRCVHRVEIIGRHVAGS